MKIFRLPLLAALLPFFASYAHSGPALDALPAAAVSPAPVSAPSYALPQKGGYDWSGLPAYIFTDGTDMGKPLVTAIDRANYTLDIALYNLQLDETVAAMKRARDRGVKVRVLFDYDHVYPKAGRQIQQVIDSGIETRVMKGRGGSGSMHCKYAVFDRTLLVTGSANWSLSAQNTSYENMLFTAEPYFAAGYTAAYDWMWAQAKPAGRPDEAAAKPTPPPADPNPSLNFNGAYLPHYIFSPRGGTTAAIVKAIDAARSSVEVAMFSFTSVPLMDALKRAAARGVEVRVLLYPRSSFPFKEDAKSAGIAVRYEGGRTENGIMHHKYAVLDGKLLINGSFNWSATAEDINTENTIFTLEPVYVKGYREQFEKLYAY